VDRPVFFLAARLVLGGGIIIGVILEGGIVGVPFFEIKPLD
jgi:hypothetical protein